MPSLQEVLEYRKRLNDDAVALIEKKGHDYARAYQENGGDTLFNLRVAEILKIVPTAESGVLVRLSDKFMRLVSLMAPGVEASVSDESLRDTVMDIHNYSSYALQLWEERKAKK